jgi:L-galactose dehydrogenase
MRFSLSRPDIHVTLTGVASLAALRQNLAYCDGKGLEPEELQRVYRLFQGQTVFS